MDSMIIYVYLSSIFIGTEVAYDKQDAEEEEEEARMLFAHHV